MQQAWREKVSLVTIIILLCSAVGFLTFGFNVTVCGREPNRIRANGVSLTQAVILGRAYSLVHVLHPVPLPGIPADGNLLNSPTRAGGKDLSFLFQNVDGYCKGLLVPSKTDVAAAEVVNYFPCKAIDPWWANVTPTDNPKMVGCHTSTVARRALARVKVVGEVYYTWDDLRKNETSLVAYNGNVLDLNRLNLLIPTIPIPPIIANFASPESGFLGHDASYWLSMTADRVQMARCLTDIVKVGVVDSRSPGCIFSDIVLWISLFVIVGVVMIRFFLAVLFGWFLSWRLGTIREETLEERRKREEDLLKWEMTDNENLHYHRSDTVVSTPTAGGGTGGFTGTPSGRSRSAVGMQSPSPTMQKSAGRMKFLPTTSRFTQPGVNGWMDLPGTGRWVTNFNMTTPHGFDTNGSRQFYPSGMPNSVSIPNLSTRNNSGAHGRSEPELPNASEGDISSHVAERWQTVHPYNPSGQTHNSLIRSLDSSRGNIDPSRASSRNSLSIKSIPTPGSASSSVSSSVSSPTISVAGQKLYNFNFTLLPTFMLVTCYSEGVDGLRTTLDSLASTEYPATHKMLLVICDGMITGSGNAASTPDIVLSMMRDMIVPRELVRPASYVAIADGQKRHNMCKIYAGFYRYDDTVPIETQQRVPMVAIVKCGTPAEAEDKKAGNRGKRDSQVILMSFLQKIYYGDRMCELDYEFYKAIHRLTGLHPGRFEIVLMVDADTKVFPDSLARMIAVMSRDQLIMGLCGETRIANKSDSWVTMIQVFEYYISHHMSKAFESIFGGVTCLPGCFCMYRIIAPKGNRFVPVLCSSDIVEMYSENVVDTLHKKNLLLLGEDRYLTTLMLGTFPKRKMMFVPQAVCKTVVPDTFRVLLSQRRRWINSTVHNLLELVLIRDLCGTFCFSMQFVVFMELVGTVVLPAAISFTLYLVIISFFVRPVPIIPLLLLAAILGLPAVLIALTTRKMVYVGWMLVYLFSLPIWNFVLPVYAYWHFDDFSWGQTRLVQGEVKGDDHSRKEGEFDSSQIVMKRFEEWERGERTAESERERLRHGNGARNGSPNSGGGQGTPSGYHTERFSPMQVPLRRSTSQLVSRCGGSGSEEPYIVQSSMLTKAPNQIYRERYTIPVPPSSSASRLGNVASLPTGAGWSEGPSVAQYPTLLREPSNLITASTLGLVNGDGNWAVDDMGVSEGGRANLKSMPSLPVLNLGSSNYGGIEIEMDELTREWLGKSSSSSPSSAYVTGETRVRKEGRQR
ncbi:chitin synthase-domain-containing protein [Jimgerdemannia flammicorona]|uniref:chitin synthase n=1 Tax=Jimgerdemannia flammicorona TaxID=994334 RepID=A0A433QFK7_9FUNG|nr:chitin synthase-domain-containing protein [Jimgerdemannia flammicorona]